MRISDGSSDVCSSDLRHRRAEGLRRKRLQRMRQHQPPLRVLSRRQVALRDVEQFGHQRGRLAHAAVARITAAIADVERVAGRCQQLQEKEAVVLAHRSEEHTSELQSLMRISYAVFCLKKKN